MKSKLFLTSLTAIAIAMPAMAETFPVDGYMKENKTYTNAATSTNMDGVYENSVNAIAEYENINYNLTAGKYLPQSSVTITDCPSGSYCTGIGNVNYSTTTAQGATLCSTVGDNTYTQSDTGASAETDCYKACATSMVAHAATVSGNDYYGAGVDTCEAVTCVNGYHKSTGMSASDITTMTTTIGNTMGAYYAGINNSNGFGEWYGSIDEEASQGQGYYGISGKNSFAVDYGANKGIIRGHGRCSKTGVTRPWYNTQGHQFASDHFVNNLMDETGEEGALNCYCQLDSYTNGQTTYGLSAPWVFLGGEDDYGDAADCADGCAESCAGYLWADDDTYSLAFRAAVFGAIEPGLASCEANTITINWTDAAEGAVAANNAGTATYGGDIRTPSAAVDKTNIGLRFKGWKFSKPQN